MFSLGCDSVRLFVSGLYYSRSDWYCCYVVHIHSVHAGSVRIGFTVVALQPDAEYPTRYVRYMRDVKLEQDSATKGHPF